MALVTKRTERLDIPNEPGEWVELRLPLCVADMRALGEASTVPDVKRAMVLHTIQAWSYAAPVDAETLERLDMGTFNWLWERINEASAVPDPEKKDSSSPSPATTEPAGEPSLASSGIS